MPQSKMLNPATRSSRVMLLTLVLLLAACGATSPPRPPELPPPPQPLPTKPSLNTALPPVSYSISASENIKAWQKSLMGTRLMSEPSLTLGR